MINEILSELNEEEVLAQSAKVAEKYEKNKSFKNDYEKKWKISQYLMSRGFKYERTEE